MKANSMVDLLPLVKAVGTAHKLALERLESHDYCYPGYVWAERGVSWLLPVWFVIRERG